MRQGMRPGKAGVYLVLSLATLLGACATTPVEPRQASVAANPTTPATHRLTGDEYGGTLDLAVGQVLEIAVGSNASTGYAWERADVGTGVLVEMPAEYIGIDNPNRMVGVGGTLVQRYRVARAGQETLQLVYRRSWEKDVPPAETVTVTVRAH